MALINTTTTGIQGSTFYADGTGALTIQQNGQTINKITSQPAFYVYRTSDQTGISAGAWTKIQFNVEGFDTANCFDSTTNYRFTPNVAGYYQFSATIRSDDISSQGLQPVIYKNGSLFMRGNYFVASGQSQYHFSGLVYLNGSTDYVELYTFLSGVTNRSVVGEQTVCYWTGFLAKAA